MSEHLRHQERSGPKERNFYLRSMNERFPFAGGSTGRAELRQPDPIPDQETLVQYGSLVLVGATVLLHQTKDGSARLTLLDPKTTDSEVMETLPVVLAPQGPHKATPLVLEHGFSVQRTVLTVAEESEDEMRARLSGEVPISPDQLIGRLMLNGEQFTPVLGGTLALSLARLGRRGLDHITGHLTEHQAH